jgi:peptidoglycan/xylan/chitin deacetylase (PgdA/CDA1 family)
VITFDDGYRDVLENALPVLAEHGYPAVMFVPIGYLDGGRPLPHEARLAARGLVNRTVDWGELAELEAGGIRIESHGISHRPLSDLDVDQAASEITLSKLRLEDRLGRPVRAFAYAKGAEAHYELVHVSLLRQAGYDVAFTSVSGANTPETDPMRLRRYNIEPYPPRTFELVLAGACDLIAVKDTVPGTHTRRLLNEVLGTASE